MESVFGRGSAVTRPTLAHQHNAECWGEKRRAERLIGKHWYAMKSRALRKAEGAWWGSSIAWWELAGGSRRVLRDGRTAARQPLMHSKRT
eukprot:1137483-Pelagomonas_calceolata.AAC.4